MEKEGLLMSIYYAKESKSKRWDKMTYQEIKKEFEDKGFSEFINKFPIISRYIIKYGEFEIKSFKRFLKLGQPNSQVDWAHNHASYVKWLYMYYNKHSNLQDRIKIYNTTKQQLLDEVSDFKKDCEEAKAKVKDSENLANDNIKKNIIARMKMDEKYNSKIKQAYLLQKDSK